MSNISKVILTMSFVLAAIEVILRVPSQHLSVPLMVAISASPPLRPNRLTLFFAFVTSLGVILYPFIHSDSTVKASFVVALVSFAIGLFRWRAQVVRGSS
jgi:RsiW-degrading membrane proteinase PrsW (M82 family)